MQRSIQSKKKLPLEPLKRPGNESSGVPVKMTSKPANISTDYLGVNNAIHEYLVKQGMVRTLELFQDEIRQQINKGTQEVPQYDVALLELFQKGNSAGFFEMWETYIPLSLRMIDNAALKLDFDLHLYFTIYSIHPSITRKPQGSKEKGIKGKSVSGAIDQKKLASFKSFLEKNGHIYTQMVDCLPYFVLPYTVQPLSHPALGKIFTDDWVEGLMRRLASFLNKMYQTNTPPILFTWWNLFKSGGSPGATTVRNALQSRDTHTGASKVSHYTPSSPFNHSELNAYEDYVGKLEAESEKHIQVIIQKEKEIEHLNQQFSQYKAKNDKRRQDLHDLVQQFSTVAGSVFELSEKMLKAATFPKVALKNEFTTKLEAFRGVCQDPKMSMQLLGSQESAPGYRPPAENTKSSLEYSHSPDTKSNASNLQNSTVSHNVRDSSLFTDGMKPSNLQFPFSLINFQKLKTEVKQEKNKEKLLAVLQALRKRITTTSDCFIRRQVVCDYKINNLLEINIFADGGFKAFYKHFLSFDDMAIKESFVRLINAISNDFVGRSYLIESPELLIEIIEIFFMTKDKECPLRSNCIAAMSRLSVRRQAQDLLIETNVIGAIVTIIQNEMDTINSYALLFGASFFTNIFFRKNAILKCLEMPEMVIDVLIGLLQRENEEIQIFSYGALYSLFLSSTFRTTAKEKGLKELLLQYKELRPETKKQFEYVWEQFNRTDDTLDGLDLTVSSALWGSLMRIQMGRVGK